MVRAVDLTAAMSRAIDPMRLMQRVTDRTLELIAAANGVMVGLADPLGVTYVCGAGHQPSALGTRVDLYTSLSGLAARTGELQFAEDVAADPRVDAEACRRLNVASLVCVPLARQQQMLGVLAVNARCAFAFDDDDIATLTQLADFISVVIGSACDLSRVNAQLLEHGESAIGGLGEDATADRAAVEAARRYVMGVLSPATMTRLDSSQRIQRVLDEPSKLAMVYQPIVDLATDRLAAAEALARFDIAPYRTPDRWFAEAHDAHLGVDLEMLAINQAIETIPDLPDGVALTINAGPQVVKSLELRQAVLAAPSHRIIIELTEHVAVDDYSSLVAALRGMRQAGARVAIDDTGSGYSSLAHILRLAPDFIKLDRDLVSGIDVDPVRRALAASLITFAADTGAQIIAEGVESGDELESLRGLGVQYAQGYLLGYPGPLDALSSLPRHLPAKDAAAKVS
jgi:EAL domain-containing protein (putative c-di-GMP-specific phosphodiesterase class I)